MQLLEAPPRKFYLPTSEPPMPEGQMRNNIELSKNLTPQAKRILMEIANKNSKAAEITLQTADKLH